MKQINKLILYNCLINFFLYCFVNTIQGQSLTKTQMQEDLLFLQNHVHQYFYSLPLLEQRTGIKTDAEFDKLKHEITSTTTIEEFTDIIRQSLNMLNDGHSQIIPRYSLMGFISPEYYLSSIGNVSLADTANADYFYKLTVANDPKVKTGIRTKFINGTYYNIRPYTVNGIPVKSGEKITKINGIPMNLFIQDNYLKMYNLFWSPSDSMYYSSLFTRALPSLNMEKFTLTIGNRDVELELDKTVEDLQKEHSQSNKREMMILDDKILYIRMPVVADAEWYINELLRIYTPTVSKIIIDVRSNPGGDDEVWNILLRKIIDKPLKYKFHVGINHNDSIEKALLGAFPELKMIRKDNTTEIYAEKVLLPDRGVRQNSD